MISIGGVILIWFVVSTFIHVTGTIVLWVWLRRRGIDAISIIIGVPGYLEWLFVGWCSSNDRSWTRVLVFRIISTVNVIVAALSAALLLGPG